MEDDTQLFRLAGITEEIPCDHVHSQSIIYWEDIVQVFPGVKHVKNGNLVVKMLRDSNEDRIVPFRIKHYPGVILDVVLSTSDEGSPDVAGRSRDMTSLSTVGEDVESLQVSGLYADTLTGDNGAFTLSGSSTLPFKDHPNLKRGLSFSKITTLARKDFIQSEIELQLVSSLPSDLQAQVRASDNVRESLIQAIKDGQVQQANEQLAACLQELDEKIVEIKDMASKITDLVCRNNDLASKNNELASKNNEMGCKIIEMGSGIMDLASKNNDLASMNNELAYENNRIANENKDHLAKLSQLQKILDAKQDEMKELQTQALDLLALLQTNVQSLLTQTFELHEYPIPRLFIVLPLDSSSWNPLDLLANRFRLYFLCECGEHTKSINSRIPHHIHLAKHEGYELTHPNEFFQRYGFHVLTVLQMLKYGITVAGVAVPALSHLISPDALGHVVDSLKSLKKSLEPGVDQVIGYIKKVSADEGQAVVRLSDQMDNKEALEGADLRQLESFLKNKDSNRVLGNLYRTVTTEGHVKWVCIDHFRENYHEKAATSFRQTVASLQGSYDETIGRVEVILYSKVQAEQFYQALIRAKSVYELKIKLDWDTTQHDFKKLCETLAITNVGVLELDLESNDDGHRREVLTRNQRYDPILDMMGHPTMRSFKIRGPRNFSRRSSISSRNDDFSNLRHLDISLEDLRHDISGAQHLITKAPNLSKFTIGTNSLDVTGNELEEIAVEALAKTANSGSVFKELKLSREGQLDDSFIDNISSIVGHSELSHINIWMRGDEGRVRILESIQWKYLCELEIELKTGTLETSVMRALVNGVTRISEKVGLERFWFGTRTWNSSVSLPEEDLLQTFVASIAIRRLYLLVDMTLEQILSLLKSVDYSRLEELYLWATDFDSVEVDTILDGLPDTAKLKILELTNAYITNEQKNRMKWKGINLQNW
ncbi:hypothetical protein BGX34_001158 [Mortierella sp. NVP85]|nr:hypothetical protein BGX34_001158 [Mortierella sp. NVP85]